MPTAAKLAAAIWFALLAWFTAELVKPYMPDGTQFGFMSEIAAFFGFLTGWVFLGNRAGDTMASALSYGFTASLIMAFWAIFYFAFETMIKGALAGQYGSSPTRALLSVIDLMREMSLYLIKPDVLIVLIGGGFFGGFITEKISRRWS